MARRSKAKRWKERLQTPHKRVTKLDLLIDPTIPVPLSREKARELKAWLNEYKAKLGCVNGCGETHPAALSFHHRVRSQKAFCIGESHKLGKTKTQVETEVAKCDVICHNCHAKLHWRETH